MAVLVARVVAQHGNCFRDIGLSVYAGIDQSDYIGSDASGIFRNRLRQLADRVFFLCHFRGARRAFLTGCYGNHGVHINKHRFPVIVRIRVHGRFSIGILQKVNAFEGGDHVLGIEDQIIASRHQKSLGGEIHERQLFGCKQRILRDSCKDRFVRLFLRLLRKFRIFGQHAITQQHRAAQAVILLLHPVGGIALDGADS